jgi:hypothetical protein
MSRKTAFALAALALLVGGSPALAQGAKADSTSKKKSMVQGEKRKSMTTAAKVADDAPAPTKKSLMGGTKLSASTPKSAASGKRRHDLAAPTEKDAASKDAAKMRKANKSAAKGKADSAAKKP